MFIVVIIETPIIIVVLADVIKRNPRHGHRSDIRQTINIGIILSSVKDMSIIYAHTTAQGNSLPAAKVCI